MNKLLVNRSSKTVQVDAIGKIRRALQLMQEVLGDETPITDAAYKGLRKIADKLKQECDDVLHIMKESQEFVVAPLSTVEMDKDKAYYELCDQIRSMLNAFLLKLDREQNIAGSEYFMACNIFEADINAKVKRGDVKAQNVQAQLKLIPRNRAGGVAKKVIPVNKV